MTPGENPFRAPGADVRAPDAPGTAAPPRRFRLRVVPATLCTIFGGAGLAVSTLMLAEAASRPGRVAGLVRAVPASLILAGGLWLLAAARSWWKGRPGSALARTTVGLLCYFAVPIASDLARDRSRPAPRAASPAPTPEAPSPP